MLIQIRKKFLFNQVNMKIEISMLFYNSNFHPVNSICISLNKQETITYSVQIKAQSSFNDTNFLPQINAITFSKIIQVGKNITLNSLISKEETGHFIFNMITKVGY